MAARLCLLAKVVPFFPPIAMMAVAKASARIQLGWNTVTEAKLCSTGYPSLGEIVWEYRFSL